MTRDEQKEERRKKILLTGLDLFVSKGLHATKISDIAKEVGMSTGLMFHYFESKEALYLELVNIGLSNSSVNTKNNEVNAIEFFENITSSILDSIKESSYIAKMFVFMQQATNNELLTSELRYKIKWENIKATEKLIIQGQKEGTIREGNPTVLATTFWFSIYGICQSVLTDEEILCPEPEWIVDIIRVR